MSIKDKFGQLLENVLAATQHGKINWEETADEDTFSAKLSKGTIFISRRFVPAQELGEAEWQYVASLYDRRGKLSEELQDWGDFLEKNLLSELHAEARRSARHTEEMLDSLLKEMQESLGE